MKWNNKGVELDKRLEKYQIDCQGDFKFLIFGAGKNGKRLLENYSYRDSVIGFLDNDKEKVGSVIEGKKVFSVDEYLQMESVKVVISPTNFLGDEIEKQLQQYGKKPWVDYYRYNEFTTEVFPLYELYKYDYLHIFHAQIALTERCTLSCVKCCHGCNLIQNRAQCVDMSLDEAKTSADYFFNNFDRVDNFALLGGEPLLYKHLIAIIEYIGKNYRDKMSLFYIVTNGTLMPSDELIRVCKMYNVTFQISDYRGTNERLKPQIERLVNLLQKAGVLYELNGTEDWWLDFGFEGQKYGEEGTMKVFDACQSQCREIRENRFYYCIMARAYSENSGMHIGADDYLDLDFIAENKKKILMEYCLGYSDKGYLEMCSYCNGMNDRTKLIPAGVQPAAQEDGNI